MPDCCAAARRSRQSWLVGLLAANKEAHPCAKGPGRQHTPISLIHFYQTSGLASCIKGTCLEREAETAEWEVSEERNWLVVRSGYDCVCVWPRRTIDGRLLLELTNG